ncbi:MAG: acetylxylan esterase [Firmicutes bacterium]|nr:acetylxylan esterase [Bacillota bacterium]
MTVQELEQYSPSIGFYDVKDQLRSVIYKLTEEAASTGNAIRDAINNIDELEKRKAFIREKLIESLGGLPPSDTPLNPQITGVIHCNGFRIEKVIFESRPKVFVTANLYVPDGVEYPVGAVLFLCGHHERAKHEDEYQIVCQYLVRAGLVVLAQDPIGQGERFSYYEKSINSTTVRWGIYEHDYAGIQCWPVGDASARYFLHDAMRGIDYLCTRSEVDPDKIGVTGNSGGGTQTALMMICDPRIAAAAPATFITSRIAHLYTGGPADAEHIWPGMSVYGFDHEDMIISMAPKPVLVLAATSDYFPIEGTRWTVERAKRFWEMYGKIDNIELFEDNSPHKYTQSMAKKAAEFFSKHLLSRKTLPILQEDEEIRPIESSRLWCTNSGQVRGEMQGARFIYHGNCNRLDEIEKQRETIPEDQRRKMAIKWLKEKVYYNRKPCEYNCRHLMVTQVDELVVQASMWWTQEGIFNYGVLFRDYQFIGEDLPATIAVWDGGTTQIQPHIKWIRDTCNLRRAVMVLDTSGVGNILPNSFRSMPPLDFYGVIFKLVNDLMWLGDSMATLRTYDVLRAIEVVQQFPGIKKGDVHLYAYGRQGLYAQLAAALNESIKDLEVVEGIGSFTSLVKSRYYDRYDIMSIILPGMLKYFDLPDIDRWVKERKLKKGIDHVHNEFDEYEKNGDE